MVLMADNGRYVGGAFVTFKADKRRALSDRVQGKIGRSTAERAREGESRVAQSWPRRPGEEKLRHASFRDFRES
ncbi:hypothetical protein [Mesorhizobium sp. WSM4884]|uniref:hypothetical protein n=1 Tax=Mesorhizobium sp. WSM4884 TaxID=3038542 RepID=UPI0024166EE2|nr:hypothetical protein [Mesorhizobium sp. WSM4884]